MAQEQMSHRLTLVERNKLTVTGVMEVVSFEDTAVVLQTVMGTLVVQGDQLQLKTLSQDGGQVEMEGTVSSLAYEQTRQRGGLLSRFWG